MNMNIDAEINKLSIYKPYDINIIDYNKYIFIITFKIMNNKHILACGGDKDKIYNFDPFRGWNEWKKAGIIFIN